MDNELRTLVRDTSTDYRALAAAHLRAGDKLAAASVMRRERERLVGVFAKLGAERHVVQLNEKITGATDPRARELGDAQVAALDAIMALERENAELGDTVCPPLGF